MSKGTDQYQEMADIFGADFESEELEDSPLATPPKSIDELQTEIAKKTEDQVPVVVEQSKKILDEDYIKSELRMGVEMMNNAAEILRSDLTPDDRPSKWDAFTGLMKERRETLLTLEQSNEKTYDRNNEASDGGQPTGGVTNNMVFTSNDALDIILQARNGLDPSKEV